MSLIRRIGLAIFVLAVSISCGRVGMAQERKAKIPKDAILAARAFIVADGIKASLFAAEPLVGNPVSIDVDPFNRVFVCETYRQSAGVEDNRDHGQDWVEEDIQSRTVEDRRKLIEKFEKDKEYSKKQDRIRLLRDRNSDGLADSSKVFVDGFNDPLDGTGAGVLYHRGRVLYTCIPKLYEFRDANNDGKADKQRALFEGFGVRFAYRGHDLHGLTLGPDGRLYFSIGDRGYNVKTPNGPLVNTESGAVFRCELDGSGLEEVATGFRNPQELAFDDYGNLFTCDNNSDGGDMARWLQVVEGGDYGWRMTYQYYSDRGPWNREELWKPKFDGQPAYIIPAVANISDGPAGLTHYPGIGLPVAYRGNFFLCDFRGNRGVSGIRTFKVRRQGAGFELIDPEVFLWNCLATDVDFGPDGTMYVSDWVEGWTGEGKGRIYKLSHGDKSTKAIQESGKLMRSGLSKYKTTDVAKLLAHVDRRIRALAQSELVSRGRFKELGTIAVKSKVQFAKLHATWGLGHLARTGTKQERAGALNELLPLMREIDEEVRAAAIKAVADADYADAGGLLAKKLGDANLHARFEILMGLSKIGRPDAFDDIVDVVVENADSDAVLRHAAVMALVHCGDVKKLKALADHPEPSARIAAVLALRRMGSPALASFLKDSDEDIVSEAVMAIHDVPVPFVYKDVAQLIDRTTDIDGMARRILNIHYRLGTAKNASRLAAYAADGAQELTHRQFALSLVSNWDSTSSRDRVTGRWLPSDVKRNGQHAVDSIKKHLDVLLESGHEIRIASAQLAARFGLTEVTDNLVGIVEDGKRSGKERAGALLALSSLEPDGLEAICEKVIAGDQPRLRAAGRIVLTQINPSAAFEKLTQAIKTGDVLERQSALAMMADVQSEESDRVLVYVADLLDREKLPPALQLDAFNAIKKRAEEVPKIDKLYQKVVARQDPANDPLAPYRMALEGGSAERGKLLFEQRAALACVRCHQINDFGGKVGPALDKIGVEKSREYLLESIVAPNQTIAKGYDTIVIQTDEGRTISGIVQKKDKKRVMLITPDGDLRTIDLASIEDTARGKSAMPDDLVLHMTLFELRDLIEYLATLGK